MPFCEWVAHLAEDSFLLAFLRILNRVLNHCPISLTPNFSFLFNQLLTVTWTSIGMKMASSHQLLQRSSGLCDYRKLKVGPFIFWKQLNLVLSLFLCMWWWGGGRRWEGRTICGSALGYFPLCAFSSNQGTIWCRELNSGFFHTRLSVSPLSYLTDSCILFLPSWFMVRQWKPTIISKRYKNYEF